MNPAIRPAERSDVAGILAIYAPIIRDTATSFELEVPTEGSFWSRIQGVMAEAPWLVCTNGDVVIGYAYASAHRKRAAYQYNRELSVYVHQDYRGRSIASALYHVLISIIKQQGYTNALIGITLPNEASVQFHEKIGFKPIGIYRDVGYKFDRYHDVGWWQMKLSSEPPQTIVHQNDLPPEVWSAAISKAMERIDRFS